MTVIPDTEFTIPEDLRSVLIAFVCNQHMPGHFTLASRREVGLS